MVSPEFVRIDPALRLAIGKGYEAGVGQSRLSRLENDVLGTQTGLKALEDALMRSNDALMRRKKKQRLVGDTAETGFRCKRPRNGKTDA